MALAYPSHDSSLGPDCPPTARTPDRNYEKKLAMATCEQPIFAHGVAPTTHTLTQLPHDLTPLWHVQVGGDAAPAGR